MAHADLLLRKGFFFPPVTNLRGKNEFADHIYKAHLLPLDSMAVGVKESLTNDCN